MRPIIINNVLHSLAILADGGEKFRTFSVEGTQLNEKKIAGYLGDNLILVTALSPVIGYQKAAHIGENAQANNLTLREAAIRSGQVDEPPSIGSATRRPWLDAAWEAPEVASAG